MSSAREDAITATFWNSTVEFARRRWRAQTLPMRAQRALSPDGNPNPVYFIVMVAFSSFSGERLGRTDERD